MGVFFARSVDALGNADAASEQSYETGCYNRIASDGTYEYEYDSEGNRTKRTDISTGYYTEYEWDHRNRLVNVTEREPDDDAWQVVDHVYDTFNRWVARWLDGDGAGTAEPMRMAYDGNQVVLEFDDENTYDVSHRYLWGPAVDQLLAAEEVDHFATEGDILWPIADHLGTVRHHAQYDDINDETDIVNTITYDTYGNVTDETGTTSILIGFTGRPFDEASGLQNNLNRWYDALVGAWVSEDPIRFRAEDTNLTRFVSNRPVVSTDPSGTTMLFHNAFPNSDIWEALSNDLPFQDVNESLGAGLPDSSYSDINNPMTQNTASGVNRRFKRGHVSAH